jgi:hypothetical protein
MSETSKEGKQKIYGILECPAKIISVEYVQEPGFGFSGSYCDEIAMWGYKPTDAVYSINVEFGKESGRSNGQMSGRFLSIEELYSLGKAYGVSKPENLVGKPVICRYAASEDRNLASIIGIEPKL